MLLVCK